MSSCVFANAVYGVVVTGKAEQKLRRYVERVLTKWDESEDDVDGDVDGDRYDAVLEHLDERHKKLMAALRALVGVPADANFYYTGDGDDSVGWSATPEDTWLAGYGLLEFPRHVAAGAFRQEPEWHTWVTGNG